MHCRVIYSYAYPVNTGCMVFRVGTSTYLNRRGSRRTTGRRSSEHNKSPGREPWASGTTRSGRSCRVDSGSQSAKKSVLGDKHYPRGPSRQSRAYTERTDRYGREFPVSAAGLAGLNLCNYVGDHGSSPPRTSTPLRACAGGSVHGLQAIRAEVLPMAGMTSVVKASTPDRNSQGRKFKQQERQREVFRIETAAVGTNRPSFITV
jgi:hypothetical protein